MKTSALFALAATASANFDLVDDVPVAQKYALIS